MHNQRKSIYANSPKSQIIDLELNDSQDVFNLSKAVSPRMGAQILKGNTSLDYSSDEKEKITPRKSIKKESLKKNKPETMNIQERKSMPVE